MRYWIQIIIQDSISSSISIILSFHDLILITIILLIRTITYIIIFLITNKYLNIKLKEAHKVELIWTIAPRIILLLLAIQSLHLLYLTEEIKNPSITVKITGHQWYWNYEYSNFPYINYNSFILTSNLLKTGNLRLLEVDNRLIVPIQTEIRLLITASDVIHSWTIQSLGIKVDAIPGRLNQSNIILNRAGVFYGQCSEICGINHSFIPIVIESINIDSFIKWTKLIKLYNLS